MKNFLLFSVFFCVFFPFRLSAENTSAGNIYDGRADDPTIRGVLSHFLTQLGYEDYSARIQQNIDQNTGLGPKGPKTLVFNRDRYQIFNQTREMAVEMLSELAKRPNDEALRQKMVEFTARMMAVKPYDGPREIPPELLVGVPRDKIEEVGLKYLAEETAKNMVKHARQVASDAVETLYGPEVIQGLETELHDHGRLSPASQAIADRIKRLEFLGSEVTRQMYYDSEMGESPELGGALALGLKRQADFTHDQALWQSLTRAAVAHHTDVRNFVGSTLVFHDNHKKERTIDVRTGDYFNERTREGEAGEIVGAAGPARQNLQEAKDKKLTGLLSAGFIYPDVPSNAPIEKLRLRIASLPLFTRGFSHVGMAKVYEADGIRTVRILDEYPSSNPQDASKPDGAISAGGIRVIRIQQFGLEGPVMRVGRTRYDAEAFRKWARQQIHAYGYQPVAWVGKQYPLDANGEEDKTKPPTPVTWNTDISEKDFYELHNLPQEIPRGIQTWLKTLGQQPGTPEEVAGWTRGLDGQARYVQIPLEVQRWLKNFGNGLTLTNDVADWLRALKADRLAEDPKQVREWYAKVTELETKQMLKYLEKYGIPFATGFTDGYDLYCTKNCWMSGKQGAGLDFQRYRDQWSWKIALMRLLGVKAARDLDPGAIFAPGTFAWHKLFTHGKEGKVDIVDYPEMTLAQQNAAVTQRPVEPMNPDLASHLEALGPIVPFAAGDHPADDLVNSIGLRIKGETTKTKVLRAEAIRSGGVAQSSVMGLCAAQVSKLGN